MSENDGTVLELTGTGLRSWKGHRIGIGWHGRTKADGETRVPAARIVVMTEDRQEFERHLCQLGDEVDVAGDRFRVEAIDRDDHGKKRVRLRPLS